MNYPKKLVLVIPLFFVFFLNLRGLISEQFFTGFLGLTCIAISALIYFGKWYFLILSLEDPERMTANNQRVAKRDSLLCLSLGLILIAWAIFS